MKKIHFDKYNSWTNVILVTLAAVCIFIGLWHISELDNSIWYSRINAFGYFLFVVFFAKMFVWKNYVFWNKRGILIKIGSFLGKNLRFNDIKVVENKNGSLNIRKKDGNNYSFDLAKICESDIKKLDEILTKNTVANER